MGLSQELEEDAEQTFAMAALILCVVAAVIFGCYKVYSRLRYLVFERLLLQSS